MTALFDIDSMVYTAMYKVVTIEDMRKKLSEIDYSKNVRLQKTDIREWIVSIAFERLEKQTYKILEDAENYGLPISKVEYFITYCPRSERVRIEPSYKGNRDNSNYRLWAKRLRAFIAEKSEMDCRYNLKWEADDLIYNRAKVLRENNQEFVVFSIDKDLIQIEGTHFNFYQIKEKVEFVREIPEEVYLENRSLLNKEYLCEKSGSMRKLYTFSNQYKGLDNIDRFTCRNFLLKQMILGDTADNIKGIKGKGAVWVENNFTTDLRKNALLVIKTYKDTYGLKHREIRKKTFRLLKIGY